MIGEDRSSAGPIRAARPRAWRALIVTPSATSRVRIGRSSVMGARRNRLGCRLRTAAKTGWWRGSDVGPSTMPSQVPLPPQPTQLAHRPQQQRLLRMEPVLGLVPHRRLRPVDHASLTSSPRCAGRQWRKVASRAPPAPSSPRRPGSGERLAPIFLVALAHRGPGVGHHHLGIRRPPRAGRRRSRCGRGAGQRTSRRRARTRWGSRPQLEVHQRGRLDQRIADIIAVADPRPALPASLARCSITVCMSARIWHGCDRSVSPLITGTVACSASSRPWRGRRCGS
jgi:hypothetical protein